MKVDELNYVVEKINSFKLKLQRESVPEEIQNTILKIYITELTDRIRVNMLEVI